MKLIFSCTTGRSGSGYLAELFRTNFNDPIVFHELLYYGAHGRDTPDVSHNTIFNAYGNEAPIQQFWKTKMERIEEFSADTYIETCHMLMKAGMFENLSELANEHELHFIILKRDPLKTIKSLRQRLDFMDIGNQWLWYLDPEYPRNMVQSFTNLESDIYAKYYWYVSEVMTRAYYYQLKYQNQPNINFHEYDIS